VLPEKTRHKEKINSLIQSRPDCVVYELTRSQWQKIGQDKEPEGLMAVVSMKDQATLSGCLSLIKGDVLVLYEIGNPQNLGALMRSAQWFGFDCAILSVNCVDYSHPKAVRASMGSLFHLTIVSGVDLIATLPQIKKTHYIIGSDAHRGVPPHPLPEKVALLLGSESHGLPQQLLDLANERWCIPGNTQADSLSLPQAAAIMMYECVKK
jgi:TrmH family RNA methyltransferase